MTKSDDENLDGFFAAARATQVTVSDDLTARVLADAASVLAAPAAAQVVPRRSWLTRALDALGGWPAMGGVVAAGIGGLWIGVAPPAGVEDWAATLVGTTEQVSLFMDIDDVALEAVDG